MDVFHNLLSELALVLGNNDAGRGEAIIRAEWAKDRNFRILPFTPIVVTRDGIEGKVMAETACANGYLKISKSENWINNIPLIFIHELAHIIDCPESTSVLTTQFVAGIQTACIDMNQVVIPTLFICPNPDDPNSATYEPHSSISTNGVEVSTLYGNTASYEDFAESFGLYVYQAYQLILDPESSAAANIREAYPLRMQYVHDKVFGYLTSITGREVYSCPEWLNELDPFGEFEQTWKDQICGAINS